MSTRICYLTGLLICFAAANAFAADHENWMSKIPDSTKLTRISIPGSHDSGSYLLSEPITSVWAKTQSLNFTQQLNGGIRFFDIRGAATSDTHIDLYHGIVYLQQDLDNFIASARKFLTEHPRETIIMLIKQDAGASSGVTKSFDKVFFDSYFPDPLFYKGCSGTPNVGETRGKIVLFKRITDPDFRNCSRGYNLSKWPDSATFNQTYNFSYSGRIQDEYNDYYSAKLTAIKQMVDYSDRSNNDEELLVNYLSVASGGVTTSSPYYYSTWLNWATENYIKYGNDEDQKNIVKRRRLGWVVMDYAADVYPGLVDEIIRSNASLTGNNSLARVSDSTRNDSLRRGQK